MPMTKFQVTVGDHVFLLGNDEEIGAVRVVHKDHLTIYVENAGDFEIHGEQIQSVHDGKVVLDPAKAEPGLIEAAKHAHDSESR